jgi:hypothetical protein
MAAARHPARALILHLLRIKGVGEADALSGPTGLDEGALHTLLGQLAASGLVERRGGALAGWRPTPLGVKHDDAWLAEELAAPTVRAAVVTSYRGFLALNQEVLAACTAWQLRGGDGGSVVANDHSDQSYDAEVVARLAGIHHRAWPVVLGLARTLRRFDRYPLRLAGALERVEAGEGDWFTRPSIDSYHQVWFELHQDLLFTLGLTRGSEDIGGDRG